MEEIFNRLIKLANKKDGDFSAKLMPTIPRENILGIKVTPLRKLAKELLNTDVGENFMQELPHKYFEENCLHFFIVSYIKDFDRAIYETERFLPYLDNWATCDEFSSATFKKNSHKLLAYTDKWLKDVNPYTVRFAIGVLMKYFLDEDFNPVYLEKVANVKSEEYYVNMMIAWYFATALAKQYDHAIEYIENKKLTPFCHNKAIQKAIESFRVEKEHKDYLKTLKIK